MKKKSIRKPRNVRRFRRLELILLVVSLSLGGVSSAHGGFPGDSVMICCAFLERHHLAAPVPWSPPNTNVTAFPFDHVEPRCEALGQNQSVLPRS